MRVQAKERKAVLTALCLMLGLYALSGCSYLRSPDRSADSIEVPHTSSTTDTKREACVRACNQERDICNAGPESRNQVFDAPQAVVGAGAGCDQAMRNCLRYCK